ncbi:hypothetical protein [Streptomyces sp. NPDC015125]|uniref:hypothetical protein n=1 Tax=Streptomyces sp. NPDC015125 TaxID=3364938 RepID=UPI0036FD0156
MSDHTTVEGEHPIRFAQRFVIVRRDGDDVQGVRFRSGRVLVDDENGLTTAACIHHLIRGFGGERRASVVWEKDRPPARCCPAGEHPETAAGA